MWGGAAFSLKKAGMVVILRKDGTKEDIKIMEQFVIVEICMTHSCDKTPTLFDNKTRKHIFN